MNVLTPEFQTSLTKAILQDHSFLPNYRSFIDKSLFKDDFEFVLVKYALSFFDKYKSTPSPGSLFNSIVKDGYVAEDLDGMQSYYEDKVEDLDFIRDHVLDFIKKTRLRDVILNSNQLLDRGDYDSIYDSIKEVVFSHAGDDGIGSVFWEDKKSVLEQLDIVEPFIPTGINELDDVLNGGAIRGTLNVVITPPNRGKTTTLVNLGRNAVLQGRNVVHYTFELSERVINRRYFMSMTRMTKQELKKKKRTAYGKILDLAEGKLKQSLIVKKFPANMCTPNDARRHLNYRRNKYGFVPDLIIFDYADIMAASKRYTERRFEIESIYYDIRNIAEELNTVTWTASQTNRGWKEKEVVTVEDVDECYKKAAASDVMLSVNQTLEEKRGRPQTARLFLTKNRDDESEVEIEIQTDWSKAWMGNL